MLWIAERFGQLERSHSFQTQQNKTKQYKTKWGRIYKNRKIRKRNKNPFSFLSPPKKKPQIRRLDKRRQKKKKKENSKVFGREAKRPQSEDYLWGECFALLNV